MARRSTRVIGVVVFALVAATVPAHAQDLRRAIFDGDLSALRAALANRPNVNVPDARGWTHVMNAAAYSKGPRADIVAALLDTGASLEAVNDEGDTALIAATRYARINAPVVRLLLARGANANAKRKDGKTALMQASFNLETEEIQALVEKGAAVDATDQDGDTALLVAIREAYVPPDAPNGWEEARESSILRAIEPLLTQGANPNAKNKKGQTPLSLVERWLTHTDRPAIADRLRKAGAR